MITPPDATMPGGWQAIYTAGILLALLAFGGNALRVWHRTKDPIPLFCILGGAVCTLLEPMVDILGLCWYPRPGQTQLFELMGRPIPMFVLPGYMFFMGGLTVLAIGVVERRGRRALFGLFPLLMLVELPFELVANHTGVYTYYGHQPLRIFDFPVWWLFVNTLVPLTAGLAITGLRPMLRGRRGWLVVALLPMLDAGINAAAGWPTWIVLNSEVPSFVTQAGGIATCALAVLGLLLLTASTDAPDTEGAL
ncbi:MAG: hypothetical protein ACR2LQ_04945 [Acidimicrobiales bacterium]